MGGRIVIAGAGLAGMRTAEQLKVAGWAGSITVVGTETHPPYNRPPLTKDALRDGVDATKLTFPMNPNLSDVEWRLGTRVVAADLPSRVVTIDDRDHGPEQLTFDGLVIATGVRSRRLPLDAPLAWRTSVRTLEDAQELRSRLAPGVPVVIIGAGFIGCEVAASAVALGCTVTVVEPLGTPLGRVLGPTLGAEVQRRHECHGVKFEVGHSVIAIAGDAEGPRSVELDDGRHLPARVVVEAVGSVPNVEWLDQQDLDLTNGVLCNRDLRALGSTREHDNVVAVGDVARFPMPLYGDEPHRTEHWNMAGDTASHAARSLLSALTGEPRHKPGPELLPSFWTDQYGMRTQSFGLLSHGIDDVRVLEGDLQSEAVVGFHRDGVLVGFVLLGSQRRMMPYRSRLLEGLRALRA